MRKLATALILMGRFINKLIPKNEHQIIFESVPDVADNSKAFYEYVINLNLNQEYNLIWEIYEDTLIPKLNVKGITVVKRNSLKGFFYFFRSKYVVTTHQTFIGIKDSKQLFINLWHGMPLKAMGFAENCADELYLPIRNYDNNYILLSTSVIMKNALASCFYVDPRKIFVTGQPRNDKLFLKEKSGKNFSKLLKKETNNYNRIVLFTPTFRKWGSRVEGERKGNIFNFKDYNDRIFRKFLEDHNILFLIKMHPFEEEHYSKFFKKQNNENIIPITSEKLQNNFLDLYDILGALDILITDYSSVYFDFLLLDKPIIFLPTDLEEYSKSRGLLFEPYDFWAPGPKATNFKDFLEELEKCIKNPEYYGKERKLVNDIVNKYQDNKSCERVYNLVFGKEQNKSD